jgi:putative chitinase
MSNALDQGFFVAYLIKAVEAPESDIRIISKTLAENLPKYGIETKEQVYYILAQMSFMSSNFHKHEDYLDYSAKTLTRLWPNHFPTLDKAKIYAHNPKAIANKIYAYRMGNGSIESGDGWMFRKRGYLLVAGRNNYSIIAEKLDMSLHYLADFANTIEGAVVISILYWNVSKLNMFAEIKNFEELTKSVTGRTDCFPAALSELERVEKCWNQYFR